MGLRCSEFREFERDTKSTMRLSDWFVTNQGKGLDFFGYGSVSHAMHLFYLTFTFISVSTYYTASSSFHPVVA